MTFNQARLEISGDISSEEIWNRFGALQISLTNFVGFNFHFQNYDWDEVTFILFITEIVRR